MFFQIQLAIIAKAAEQKREEYRQEYPAAIPQQGAEVEGQVNAAPLGIRQPGKAEQRGQREQQQRREQRAEGVAQALAEHHGHTGHGPNGEEAG